MADIYQKEITKMLHSYNIFTRHEKAIPIIKGKFVAGWNTPERSTPDLTGGLVHQIHVEVKTGKNERFDFSSWSEGQREYAGKWRVVRGCEYWIAVVIETVEGPHRVKRDTFLVPSPIMIQTEDLLSGIQGSIPYSVRKGLNKKIQEENLVASVLWKRFALNWVTGQGWRLTEDHPFSEMYLNQEPYLFQGKLSHYK